MPVLARLGCLICLGLLAACSSQQVVATIGNSLKESCASHNRECTCYHCGDVHARP